ncbi:UNVERIFIED_CONTAM: hypothetical protein Sradi_3775100 [Sesamum radiatum]|uniref:Uncharacterized protein n=1 Tax=Sesamum radiatum TaxID=300843 RepID=A0AAW2PZM2_SESRA
MNLHVSGSTVGACETNDGLGEGAKDPPTVDVRDDTLDGPNGIGSIKGLCGGLSAIGAAGGVWRGCLVISEYQKRYG